MCRNKSHFLSQVKPLVTFAFWFWLLLTMPQAAHASALSDLAVSMTPGSWAQLTTNNFNNGAILKPPAGGSLLEYHDKANWNPINRTVMILGGAHSTSSSGCNETRFATYTESTNGWVNTLPNPCPNFDNAFPGGTGHDYHHDTINPQTGDFYHRQYSSTKVMKFSHASQSWSQCSPITQIAGYPNPGGALQYFPDRNSLVYIDGDWGVFELSLASGNCTGTWVTRSGVLAGISTYHNQSIYSPRCQCVLFVGQSSTAMWRMNASAAVSQVASVPLTPGIPQSGSGAIFTVDPASGHVLMWHRSNAATTMYQYDSAANTWSTISRTSPMFPGPEGGVTATVAVPISTYGVLMFVQASSSSGGKVYLYKHTAGTTPPPSDTVAPSTPAGLTATAVSSSQINLSWNASTDNVGVAGYRVERCQGSGCTTFAETASPGGTSYSDTGLSAGTTYRYRVRAADATGNLSGYSITSSATTPTSALPAFDFSLSNGGSPSVSQGQTTSNTVSASLTSGTAQAVSFSAAGLPAGATATFATPSCSPTCSTNITIATASSTSAGSYSISVTGTGGGVVRSTSFSLTITSTTPPPPPSGNVVTSITLTSPSTQSAAPFAIGQPFRQGDIPSGASVVANIPNFQATVKSRWSDGSVQFAILAGRAALQANTPLRVHLSAGTAPTGTNLTEQDLANRGANMQISFGSIGNVQLSSLIGTVGSYNSTRNQWNAGKVLDWILGPEMSSWVYSSPVGNDASLTAWFEVRLWKDGQIEILPWLENGFLNKTIAAKTGTATVSISSTQRFSQSLTLYHRSRTPLVSGTTFAHAAGSAAQLTFKHDMGYLQKTKLVPTYGATTPSSSSVLSSISTSYTPLAQANFPPQIGQTGYHPSIGLLPQWDVLYLTSNGDPRALAAITVNAYSAGRYSIHYRDEKTNRPPKFSSYPNLVSDCSGMSACGSSSTNSYTPTPSGGSGPVWATTHAPSVGFMAYLLHGRFYFMEEAQFAATAVFLKQTDTVRQFTKGILETSAGANIPRGVAWGLRAYMHAAIATPDNDPLKAELKAAIDENISYYHARYVGQSNNPQGILAPYDDYTGAGDNKWSHAMWMEDFLTGVFGYLRQTEAYSSTSGTKLTQFYNWKANSAVGRLGQPGVSTEYDFRDAAQYNIIIAPSDKPNFANGSGPWYANWGRIYTTTLGASAGTAPANQLRGGNFPDATSYWGNLQPAIAYAVTNGVPGASAAYSRMTGASNWTQFFSGFSNAPEWSIVPADTTTPPPPPSGTAPSAPTNLTLQ